MRVKQLGLRNLGLQTSSLEIGVVDDRQDGRFDHVEAIVRIEGVGAQNRQGQLPRINFEARDALLQVRPFGQRLRLVFAQAFSSITAATTTTHSALKLILFSIDLGMTIVSESWQVTIYLNKL